MESKCLWFNKFLKRLVLARIYDCFALSLQCRMYTVPCTYRAYIIHGMNSACLSLQKTGCLQPRRIAIWVLFDRTEFLHDFGHRQSLLHFHFATTTKKKRCSRITCEVQDGTSNLLAWRLIQMMVDSRSSNNKRCQFAVSHRNVCLRCRLSLIYLLRFNKQQVIQLANEWVY